MTPVYGSKSDLVADRQSLTLPLSEISRGLVSVIGKKLTAYIANANDTRAIDRWIAGGKPHKEAEERLRFAYRLAMALHERDTPNVVQAWLTGVNPELGEHVAIRMLREEPLDSVGPQILRAARIFVAGG